MSDHASTGVKRLRAKGANVISNRIESSVPDSAIDEMLEEGIFGAVDYGTGKSLDSDEAGSRTGSAALNNMVDVSRNGAYIVSFTPSFDRVFLSRVTPSSIRFEEFQDTEGETTTVLKCVEAEVYTEIEEDKFQGIYDVISDRQRLVFHNIKDSDHRERVVAALTAQERSGKIQRN